jgi:hypothetical protein
MGPIFSGTRGNDGVAPKTVAGSPVDPARHPETRTQLTAGRVNGALPPDAPEGPYTLQCCRFIVIVQGRGVPNCFALKTSPEIVP